MAREAEVGDGSPLKPLLSEDVTLVWAGWGRVPGACTRGVGVPSPGTGGEETGRGCDAPDFSCLCQALIDFLE